MNLLWGMQKCEITQLSVCLGVVGGGGSCVLIHSCLARAQSTAKLSDFSSDGLTRARVELSRLCARSIT